MPRNLVCSECGGDMERGFVVDSAGRFPQPFDASYWIEGKREKGFWTGLKTIGRKKFYILAYRCQQCGFLKFYAGSDHSGEK